MRCWKRDRFLSVALVAAALAMLLAGCSKSKVFLKPWVQGMPVEVPAFDGIIASVTRDDNLNSLSVVLQEPGMEAVRGYAETLRGKGFQDIFVAEGPGQYFANLQKGDIAVSLTYLTRDLILSVQVLAPSVPGETKA